MVSDSHSTDSPKKRSFIMGTRTARATVMSGKDFEIREYPIVDPAPGTVLVRQELGVFAVPTFTTGNFNVSTTILSSGMRTLV